MAWQDELDQIIQEHLQTLLTSLSKEKNAYMSAKNVSRAQLWCALAVLHKEISDLNLKVQNIERNLGQKPNKVLKKGLQKL